MPEFEKQSTELLPDVSVVMATLGGPSLKDTIIALNSGTVVPKEILVCIPENYAENVKDLVVSNVSVILTKCKGQVAQRAIGFQSVKYELVMQLDDDLKLERDCLENLVKALTNMLPSFAVAPKYMSIETGESFYKRPRNSFFLLAYYWVLNSKKGYKQGSITMAGSPIGHDFKEPVPDHLNTEWLPGGCILHHKRNLVLFDFYSLQGKAFAEDLFHSAVLKENGIQFAFIKNAALWLNQPENFGIFKNLKNLWSDYKARKLYLSSYPNGRSLWRMHMYYVFNFVRYIWR